MNDDGRSTVFFPGAGSFGTEFRSLGDALGRASWLVRYPGRAGRDFGKPAASFDAVVRSCAEQISRRPGPGPVLFGHSYGAYVAYATALALAGAGVEVPALVVVGATAPGLVQVPREATRSPEAAAEYLDGASPGLLAEAPSEDWRSIVAETAAQDLRLLRQFSSAGSVAHGRVHCPVLALRGEDDPLTADTALTEWKHSTAGTFVQRTVTGGHSELLHSPDFASWLREALPGIIG